VAVVVYQLVDSLCPVLVDEVDRELQDKDDQKNGDHDACVNCSNMGWCTVVVVSEELNRQAMTSDPQPSLEGTLRPSTHMNEHTYM